MAKMPPQGHVANCEVLSAWLDGELNAGERLRVEAHLMACPACRNAAREQQALRRCLAAFSSPPELQGAAEGFWRELAPRLPAPAPTQPDRAPILTPLVLVLGHALWQAGVVALGLFTLLGGWQMVAQAWPRLPIQGQWAGPLQSTIAALGTFAAASRWLNAVLPAAWWSSLWWVAGAIVSWLALLALALAYSAWMVLWLQPGPAQSSP